MLITASTCISGAVAVVEIGTQTTGTLKLTQTTGTPAQQGHRQLEQSDSWDTLATGTLITGTH